jgi:phage repressor protein C with HTH and peptisase S24 domain
VYIKKIHIEDTHVRLESLNKDTYDNGELIYPDILLENTENLRLIGKVIDSFKPIEIK